MHARSPRFPYHKIHNSFTCPKKKEKVPIGLLSSPSHDPLKVGGISVESALPSVTLSAMSSAFWHRHRRRVVKVGTSVASRQSAIGSRRIGFVHSSVGQSVRSIVASSGGGRCFGSQCWQSASSSSASARSTAATRRSTSSESASAAGVVARVDP